MWLRGGRIRVLVACWTGTGASIAANKVGGVRAGLCGDPVTAAGARRWNDANVLALSLRGDLGGVAGRDPRCLVRRRGQRRRRTISPTSPTWRRSRRATPASGTGADDARASSWPALTRGDWPEPSGPTCSPTSRSRSTATRRSTAAPARSAATPTRRCWSACASVPTRSWSAPERCGSSATAGCRRAERASSGASSAGSPPTRSR